MNTNFGQRFICVLFAAVVLITATAATGVGAKPKTDSQTLDRELKHMHEVGLFKGGKKDDKPGKGEKVEFDKSGAKKYKYAEESLAIAEQLAALSNDLVSTMSETQPGIGDTTAAVNPYPALSAYFEASAKHSQEAVNITNGYHSMVIGQFVCGWYSNPKPNAGRNWIYWSSTNPDGTMSSWGYHPTPNLAGGGWTRAQTWNPVACGFGTFRDHAYNLYGNTVAEQNYSGWSPRGEPNPEVYRVGPWPYSDWPTYVLWWHNWGPGRTNGPMRDCC